MKLEIKNLTKSYNKIVVNNLNLNVNGYSSIGIIGKSGCGKSTLLRLVSGLESFDSGLIKIDGIEVYKDNNRNLHRKMGIVFQDHNLFPHLTLMENITIILEKTRGYSKQDAKIKASHLLSELHLEDEIFKKPDEVSGGQAQRGAIARALSTDPEIIVMDEPTAALDPILTREVLESVIKLKGTGKKFIFVTHELKFVKEFAEYVVFMDQGAIVEEGSIEILNNPSSDKLKFFLDNERF